MSVEDKILATNMRDWPKRIRIHFMKDATLEAEAKQFLICRLSHGHQGYVGSLGAVEDGLWVEQTNARIEAENDLVDYARHWATSL